MCVCARASVYGVGRVTGTTTTEQEVVRVAAGEAAQRRREGMRHERPARVSALLGLAPC